MTDAWCRVCVWMHCYGSSAQSASPESFMPLHELIVRCLFTVQFKLAVRRVTPGRPLANISAFCTFLQGSSRHRLSLSQISQVLTAAARWLHYVPIWLVFAMTHLLTPTSLFRPPTTIDSSDKTDGRRWQMDFEREMIWMHPDVRPHPCYRQTCLEMSLRCRMDAQHYFESDCSTWMRSERSCGFRSHRRAIIASCCIHAKTVYKGPGKHPGVPKWMH